MKSFITTLGKVIKLNTEKNEVEQNFDEDKKRLVIPLYQREYKWSNEKVITLLRDVNKRDKFLGLIILNEKDNRYEIVDGQQRLTTALLVFVSLYNSYKGQPREQARVLSFVKRDSGIVIENESVGDYLSISDEIKLDISEDNDVYFQKGDFERVLSEIDDFVCTITEVQDRKDFFAKLVDSKLLVFINDSDDDVKSIEQMFLDINEKTQKLDNENIFKGHCFEIFKEDGYEELKEMWIHLKKVAMKFSQIFGYKDMGQYLYLYLLKDESIPENMAPKGKHYLEGKSEDDTDKLLNAMISYGESLIAFDENIHNDTYCFADFSNDCVVHRNDNNDIWVMRKMSQNILESTGAWNQKFPFMHFVANKEKYSGTITHAELKKIICNIYIYSNLFVMRSGKKSKENIDRTVIEEVQKETVSVANIIEAVKVLRKNEVDEYTISDTDNFNIISFIYSIIDFYDSGSNFVCNIYTDDKNYNLEHLVVPKRTSAIVDWVYGWKENRKGKLVPEIHKIHLDVEKAKRYRKRITDYLVIDKDLNGSFECFDIVEKVEAIKKWHEARELELPRHIQTYFNYLTNLVSYKELEGLKRNNEQDVSKIEPAYLQFVEEYFEGIELSQNVMGAFKNSF